MTSSTCVGPLIATRLIHADCRGALGSKETSYDKTFSNLDTELRAKDVLLQSDDNFHDVALPVKKRILEHLGFEGRLPTTSFDLVWTTDRLDELTLDNLAEHIDSLVLIELKATKNKHGKVRDESLRGFFFGATENEFTSSAAGGALPVRLRRAF